MPAEHMTLDELNILLDRSESELLDWKAAYPRHLFDRAHTEGHLTARGTLLKDLQALANAPGDGPRHLIYGVKDHITSRRIVGVTDPLDDADVQDWVRNALEPAPRFVLEFVPIQGKNVAVFTIYPAPSAQRPHVARATFGGLHQGQVWYRRGTQNAVADSQTLHQLFTATGVALTVTLKAANGDDINLLSPPSLRQQFELDRLKASVCDSAQLLLQRIEILYDKEPSYSNGPWDIIPSFIRRQLDDDEQHTIRRAMKELGLPVYPDWLDTPDARGDLSLGTLTRPKATEGSQAERFNALQELLDLVEQFDSDLAVVKAMHRNLPLWVAVTNDGEMALEAMRLVLTCEVGRLEENRLTRAGKTNLSTALFVAERGRLRIEGTTASIELPMLAAGDSAVFFGVSITIDAPESSSVRLNWTIVGKPLREPARGTIVVQFEAASAQVA
jgi:Putative DNA-binding domain